MNPPTLLVTTNLLAEGDVVVFGGEFWEVRGFYSLGGYGMEVTLKKGDAEIKQVDSGCMELSPAEQPEVRMATWRVVNVG